MQMDRFQMSMAAIAVIDSRWRPRDADGRRRDFTTEELDQGVEFGWHWADMKGRLAAGVGATTMLMSVWRLTGVPLRQVTAAAAYRRRQLSHPGLGTGLPGGVGPETTPGDGVPRALRPYAEL